MGAIKLNDFKLALERIQYYPGEYELNKMISELDDGNTGFIQFNQFLKVYHKFKMANSDEDDQDTIDAFVAMGGISYYYIVIPGKDDKDGHVNAEELIRIVKKEFEMSIDIEKLIQEVDEDQSGVIEFGEFKQLLKANYSNDLP